MKNQVIAEVLNQAAESDSPDKQIIGYLCILHVLVGVSHTFHVDGVTMLVHVYLTVLKREDLSNLFGDNILIGRYIGVKNHEIDTKACKKFYTLFGMQIDDTNIEHITKHWLKLF